MASAVWVMAAALTVTAAAGSAAASDPPTSGPATTSSPPARPSLAATPAAAPATATAASAGPAPSAVWSTAHPITSPPPLSYAAAAYDRDNHTLVLFGGQMANGTLSDDTWVWNGTNWTDFPNSQPGPRDMASMAFDPTQHQLILFGGQGNNGTLLSDTWAWNGQQWSQLDTSGVGPSPRDGAALGYDRSGALVLFGGLGVAPAPVPPTTVTSDTSTTAAPAQETVLGDTWQWTGSAWAASAAAGPPARTGAQMAYDSASGTTVLFSGETTPPGSGAPALAPDTWTWDGAAWSQQPATAAPPARYGAVFDDDPALGGPLLVGGAGAGGALGDGWLWRGQGWVQAQVGGAPTPLAGAAGGFDAASSAFVMFGGLGSSGATVASTELVTSAVPATVSPPTRPHPALAPTTTVPTAARPPKASSPPTTSKVTPTTAGHTPTTATTLAPVVARARALTLVANVHSVRQGASVELTGSGFEPGSPITIMFHSTPALLGHTFADGNGSFTATVDVPRSAKPGQHHFVAEGVAPSGASTELVASVFVLGPIGSHGPTGLQTAVMLILALLIPGAAWMGMSGFGWWRRRQLPAAE